MAHVMRLLQAAWQDIRRWLQAVLQEIEPTRALIGVIALLAISFLVFSLVLLWLGVTFSRQQAAEQAVKEESTTPQKTQPQEFPLVFGPGPSPRLTETNFADGHFSGVPGFGDMDLIGRLQYLPGTNFRCPGGSPDQGLYKRTCRSSSGSDSATYEVTVVEKNPTSVLWVEATAYDTSEDEAAKVLSYVAKHTLQDTDSLNAEAWVNRNISTGGQYFARGAELRLYGTQRATTLEIVANGPPAGGGVELTAETTSRGLTVSTTLPPR
jgi:hypothetical protein